MKRLIWVLSLVLIVTLSAWMPVFAQESSEEFSLQGILGQILLLILVPIAGVLGTYMAKLLKRAIVNIDNASLQSLAWVAVRWAQDKYSHVKGSDQFGKACAHVADKVKGVSGSDVEKAVAAAYQSMKAELGNAASSSTQ